MEIRFNIRPAVTWKVVLLSGIISLIYACSYSDKRVYSSSDIPFFGHTLLAMAPDFTIKVTEDTLNKTYPCLRSGKIFPVTGILKVDGKSYRFLGGDSLRISSLASLSDGNLGWQGKYSYLFPGRGWEQRKYNDSLWNEGKGAFGSENGKFQAHTAWGAKNIYVRRHITITDKDALKEHKVYLRYVYDDQIKLYCNGEYLFGKETFLPQTGCYRLMDETVAQISDGDNVLAAYGGNKEGTAFLDFGLYVENKTYADAQPAILKQTNIQATQTQFIFQCGDVELLIDFVSSSLSEKWDMTGWPVGFLSYQIRSEDGKERAVEIQFDVDTEWLFGRSKVDSWCEQDWRFVKSDSLYLAMEADESTFSSEDGHVILSQKLCAKNKDSGVLLIGYEEGQTLQYGGESLPPLWKKDGTGEVKELMKSVGDRCQELKEECDKLDCQWSVQAIKTGNKAFVGQILSSYRHFISSHRFVLSSENKIQCFGDTLGNIREAYESFPTLLYFNRIDWMKSLLDPIFEYSEDVHWVKKYPPYDIGLYPLINKQVKLDDNAVSVAADMLMMTAVIVEVEQDFSYADAHWNLLCLWADYLREKMEKDVYPCEGLLNEDDERVKCVLGLMAYRKLIQLKESV